MHKVITPVETEPVPLQLARSYLRLIASPDDVTPLPEDGIVSSLITAAREWAEHYTARALAPRTLEMALDAFPNVRRPGIELETAPATEITSIKYTDAAGVEQTVDPDSYLLDAYGSGRHVVLADDNRWPDAKRTTNAVRIRYVAGYVDAPKAAKAAILQLVAHLFENRQAASSLRVDEIPLGARSMLDTIKMWGR